MKRLLCLMLLGALSAPAWSADVGVSVRIGDPDFYGEIHIGDYPRPRLIYAEPIIIQRGMVIGSPVYLRVPPGHAKNWGRHCGHYGACGRPVYFVEDGWYQDVYVPAHRAKGKGGHGKGNGKGPPGKGGPGKG